MRLRPTIVELFVIVLLLFVLGTTGYDVYATRSGAQNGQQDATADLAAGVLRLKVGGLRRPWNARAEVLFRDRYGVELWHVHGCTPTMYQSSYTSAYNKIMMDRINRQIGPMSMSDVFDEAQEEWSKTAAN